MACFTKKELQDQYETLLNEGIDKYEAAQQVLSAEYERISSNANLIRQSIGLAEKKFTPNKIDIKSIESKYNTQAEKIRKDFESKKAKTEEPKAGSVGVGGEVETKQQIENFGVNKGDVEPVHNVISQVFNGLKKAGLTAAKTVGDWVGIGKGSEKPYSLKIDGKDVQVKNTSSDVVNGFYSPLEKVITDSKFDKLPAKQWIEKYANSEEAKWTGLKDWLAQQQGSVSKTDIQQFLKDNRIEIVEVVKGGEVSEAEIDVLLADETGEGMTRDEAREYLSNDEDNNQTKFSQYQLEGEKENYKEVLVTLPKDNGLSWKRNGSGLWAYFIGDKQVSDGVPENTNRYKELARKTINSRNVLDSKKNDFKSSHFDEPNILVHLRMNTRVDSEGKKVLFLEEVQSDWGQKGKKEGFNIPAKKNEFRKEKQMDGSWVVKDANNTAWWHGSTEERADAVINDYNTRETRIPKEVGAIPNAPFVTDTNAWTKLGLKVALKEAVKQGADKIAWTTGEQQVGRYEDDFRKQVDKIETYKRISADVPSVHVIASKGSSQVFDHIIPINGKTIVSGKEVDLEDVVGKEIANKIRNSEEKQQSFEGDALTIGGKGMEDFYGKPSDAIRSKSFTIKKEGELFAVKDEKGKTIRTFKQENEANKFKENYGLGIVGNVAKSLFKQEPKTTEITTTEGIENDYYSVYNKTTGNSVGGGYSLEAAKLKSEQNPNYGYKLEQRVTTTQHSIDITPELKASVEGGQPLFKDAEAQYRIESGRNIVEAIKDFNGSPRATVALTHEIMHPTVVSIIDGAKEGNEVGIKHTETIVNEFNKANPKNKVTVEDLIKGNDDFKKGKTSEQYRDVQEFIAKAWEKYHREGGKGFSEAFQKVLAQITKAFQSVYKSLSGKQLTPELRKMFDEILGKEAVEQSLKETPQASDNLQKAPEIGTDSKNVLPENVITRNNVFGETDSIIKEIAKSYKNKYGINTKEGISFNSISVENSKKIADAFDEMKHDPNNPEVISAYELMIKESLDQYNHIIENGYKFEIYEGKGEPYSNSREMLKDLKDNKHLFILSTLKEFGGGITEKQLTESPLLRDSGIKDINGKPLLNNDLFRGVHDFFGHGERGNSFGAVGEENAWDVHVRMFSPLAARAMTTETRGQNSWVNFGKHLRNKDGSIKEIKPKDKPFAEQKIGLLPEWISKPIDVPNQRSQVKPDETTTNKNEGKEQINNASIDEAREMFGMEQLNSSKITVEDIIKEAHQKHITPSVLDSGSYVRENNIVASVMRGKPLDAAEQYALGNLISKMKKEYRRTEEHIKEAESKKQDSSQLHNKLNETKEILQNATEALRKAGTIAGRALAIRKEFLDFNMFDEANLINDFKTNMERSNFAMSENDETFISKTANGIFFKQEEVDIQLQKEQEIIQKNKEIAAQNAFAEMNKRKEHIKTSPKLSEALANLDNVLKGKIC